MRVARHGIGQPAMVGNRQAAGCALLAALVSTGAWAVLAQETAISNVMVAHGVLARNGKAGNLWVLNVNDGLRFRDEPILEVTFLTANRRRVRSLRAI